MYLGWQVQTFGAVQLPCSQPLSHIGSHLKARCGFTLHPEQHICILLYPGLVYKICKMQTVNLKNSNYNKDRGSHKNDNEFPGQFIDTRRNKVKRLNILKYIRIIGEGFKEYIEYKQYYFKK